MSSKRVIRLRCFAEMSDGVWAAYCLDLGLGAQGDTFAEAREKLEAQIAELAEDINGQDAEYAQHLLSRKAPLSLWIKYWAVFGLIRIARTFGGAGPIDRKRFRESFPIANAIPC